MSAQAEQQSQVLPQSAVPPGDYDWELNKDNLPPKESSVVQKHMQERQRIIADEKEHRSGMWNQVFFEILAEFIGRSCISSVTLRRCSSSLRDCFSDP